MSPFLTNAGLDELAGTKNLDDLLKLAENIDLSKVKGPLSLIEFGYQTARASFTTTLVTVGTHLLFFRGRPEAVKGMLAELPCDDSYTVVVDFAYAVDDGTFNRGRRYQLKERFREELQVCRDGGGIGDFTVSTWHFSSSLADNEYVFRAGFHRSLDEDVEASPQLVADLDDSPLEKDKALGLNMRRELEGLQGRKWLRCKYFTIMAPVLFGRNRLKIDNGDEDAPAFCKMC